MAEIRTDENAPSLRSHRLPNDSRSENRIEKSIRRGGWKTKISARKYQRYKHVQGIPSVINSEGVSQLITPLKTPFLKVFGGNKDAGPKVIVRKFFLSGKQRAIGDTKTT